MIPYADPWPFLATVTKISRSDAERAVRTAEASRGHVVGVRLVPWDETADAPWEASPSRRPPVRPIAGPLPPSMELILGNDIFIAKEDVPPALQNRLIRLAAFQNPEFYRAQAMRFPSATGPRSATHSTDIRSFLPNLPGSPLCLRRQVDSFGIGGTAAHLHDQPLLDKSLQPRSGGTRR